MSRETIACALLAAMALPAVAAADTAPAQTPAQAPAQQQTQQPIVVQGHHSDVVHRIDRTVYSLANNPVAASGSMSDVLDTLPQVSVDPSGNVSVRGGSVQILVDGKPSAAFRGDNLAATLQAMPANTVARIEVITNPGAEYHTDAATVINIITKKATGPAPAGQIVVNAGPQARYNGTIVGSGGTGPWQFNASLNLRQDIRYNIYDLDRTLLNPDGTVAGHMHETTPLSVHFGAVTGDASADYTFGDHDDLMVEGNFAVRHRPRRRYDHIVDMDADGNVTSDATTFDAARQFFNNYSTAATWHHKGNVENEVFSMQGQHAEYENYADAWYTQTDAFPDTDVSRYRRLRTSRGFDDELTGDYVRPFGENRQFKTGFDFESQRDQFYTLGSTIAATSAETVDPSLTHRFLSDQWLSAGYASLEHPIGKWRAMAGLRVEALQTRLYSARGALLADLSNTQWSPSVYVEHDLIADISSIKFAYSRRVERPDTDQLNPTIQVGGVTSAFVGNPNLKPALTDSYEIEYDYGTHPFSVSATAYARQLHNTIVGYSYYAHPGDAQLISSVENAGRGQSVGFDLWFDAHISPRFEISMWGDARRVDQTALSQGIAVNRHLFTEMGKLTATFKPNKKSSIQMQYKISGSNLTADGEQGGNTQINLSYSRDLTTRLGLVVTGTDVLNRGNVKGWAQNAQYRDISRTLIPGQIVYVGLKYRLGSFTNDKPADSRPPADKGGNSSGDN